MAYGITIIEDDGTNFTETYRPFNVLDQFEVSASGTRYYSVESGERLIIIETSSFTPALGSPVVLSAVGGVVRWPIDPATAPAPGEHRAFTNIGFSIIVLRSR
jgi:hypothetical protein|uniref:hypothetical protein n=1 Tax=Aeromonas caviae TaxID=648 RepID=UPI0015EE67C4|nr:hypothetical protein [Aeromonas caviae]